MRNLLKTENEDKLDGTFFRHFHVVSNSKENCETADKLNQLMKVRFRFLHMPERFDSVK